MARVEQTSVRNGVLRELRAVPEFAAFLGSAPLLRLAPKGDGHPVLVLPGLGADDVSTRPLRWFLRQRGYWVHGWQLGTNRGLSRETTAGLSQRLDQLADRHGQPVSLVGWSMGGVHARSLAGRTPRSVRLVITLGSPLHTGRGARPLPVPATSIYSRTDAVVPWRYSLDVPGPRSENVEVRGSHLGLGHNPAVLYVVADRLAQPEGRWAPFSPPAALRRLYPADEAQPA
jgi:pimeloyl-ACP methyl ester carboxylesterase